MIDLDKIKSRFSLKRVYWNRNRIEKREDVRLAIGKQFRDDRSPVNSIQDSARFTWKGGVGHAYPRLANEIHWRRVVGRNTSQWPLIRAELSRLIGNCVHDELKLPFRFESWRKIG